MMASNGVFDFSKTIKTHAYVVGVSESTIVLLPLLLVAAIHDTIFFSQLQEVSQHMLMIAMFATVFLSIPTLFFWIGFLKKVRCCLMVFLVFIVLRALPQTLILYAAVYYLKFSVVLLTLISLAFHAYKGLVVIQLRESMLNNPMSILEDEFERLEEQRTPAEQMVEINSEKNNVS